MSMDEDWKDRVFVAKNNDGGVSVIYPAPDYQGTKENWIRRHDLDIADEYLELHPIQLPANRETRNHWIIKDGRVIVDSKVKEIDDIAI